MLSATEVATAITDNPLLEIATNDSLLLVAVLASADDRVRLKALVAKDWGAERLALGARVAYLWCPRGQIESRLAKEVWRTLGDAVTARNWATFTKLHALAQSDGGTKSR